MTTELLKSLKNSHDTVGITLLDPTVIAKNSCFCSYQLHAAFGKGSPHPMVISPQVILPQILGHLAPDLGHLTPSPAHLAPLYKTHVFFVEC